MRLAYTGAEGCPGEEAFRDAVGLQVRRWEPFAVNAPWRLTVVISRRGDAYEGSAVLSDRGGAVEWKRAFPATAKCVDLQGDLARAIALRVDPTPVPAREQPPRSSSPSVVREEVRPLGPEPAAPAQPGPLVFRLGAGTWMDLATAPRPTVGLTLDVGLRYGWFSVAAEGRWDAPASATVGGADVGTTLFLAALVPCGHYRWFAGCLVGKLGQIRGSLNAMGGTTPDHQTALYDAAGVRLAVEIPAIPSRLFVRLAADALGSRPAVFLLDGKPKWSTPSFTGGLGAGLVAAF